MSESVVLRRPFESASDIPCAIGFNGLSSRSPRGAGLVSPRRLQIIIRKLDLSVGRSGPHDLTVRTGGARLARRNVHRIPLPTSVTIAIRPSDGGGTGRVIQLICVSEKAKYFWTTGWTNEILTAN